MRTQVFEDAGHLLHQSRLIEVGGERLQAMPGAARV